MNYSESLGLYEMKGEIYDSEVKKCSIFEERNGSFSSQKNFILNSLGGSNLGAYQLGTHFFNKKYLDNNIIGSHDVCSAAIFFFMYFEKRSAMQGTRFGFHDLIFPEGTEDYKKKRTSENYAGWIAKNSKVMSRDFVLSLMRDKEELDENDALNYGLITEIKKSFY